MATAEETRAADFEKIPSEQTPLDFLASLVDELGMQIDPLLISYERAQLRGELDRASDGREQ